MKKTKIITINALLCALASAFLCLGSLLGDLDLTFAALASLTVFFAALELGMKSAYAVWIITSICSLLLSPAKFAPIIFALFVGIYPIIKLYAERKSLIFSWFLKLATLNIAVAVITLIAKFILFPGMSEAWWVYLLTFILANIATILFDFLLGRLAILYFARIRKKLGIEKFLKK